MLRQRCEADALTFARAFFEHLLPRPFAPMHRELIRLHEDARADGPLEARPPRRLAIAAPRGAAKTTLKSLILPLHATLYRRERYIAILSATLRQARQRLANIRAELETNDALRRSFHREIARRGAWNLRGINVNDVQIDIFSAGAEIRGISWRQWRPTLVLLDDIENSEAVHSPERREQLLGWYNEVIENIGDAYTAIEIIGTILHPESLLATLLKRPDFEARVYRSVIRFAERDDLWEQWRGLYANLDDPRRADTARDFFRAREADMLRGARVLWPAREGYYDLMVQLATRGRAAFYQEKQNEPGAGRGAYFNPAHARRFRIEGECIVML